MRFGLRKVSATVVLVAALAIGVAARTPSPSDATEIQLQLGDLLFAEGRYGEAAEAYQRAKAGVEERGTRLFRRAASGLVRSLLRVAEFGRARAEAVVLHQAAPRDPEAVAVYGDALWSAGLFDESEQAFRDALSLSPDVARARHGLAKALAARGDLDGAFHEAQAALKLAPREGEFHHTLGRVYERMNRFEEAAFAFGNYMNLLPNKDRSEKAMWSRQTVRFLRSFAGRTPLEMEGDHTDMLHTVPFRLVREKVVVRGSVNGGPSIDFVLDTGAEDTVLSQRMAQQVGVTPIAYTLSAGVGDVGLRGLQLGRIDLLQIGTLKIRNVPCLIKNPPLDNLPTREGESFSPVGLGLSMMIDYGKRQLIIGRRLPDEEYEAELPLRLNRLAVVRGTVNDALPASFVVDTGGEVISISLATANALRPTAPRRIPLKVYGTSGWDGNAFLLPGVNLAFQSIRYSNFPVVVLDLQAPSALLGFQVGGIVGHKFLSRYRVAIDLQRSVLRLSRG